MSIEVGAALGVAALGLILRIVAFGGSAGSSAESSLFELTGPAATGVVDGGRAALAAAAVLAVVAIPVAGRKLVGDAGADRARRGHHQPTGPARG